MVKMGSEKNMFPELDDNGQLKFCSTDNEGVFSDEERPHYMQFTKRMLSETVVSHNWD